MQRDGTGAFEAEAAGNLTAVAPLLDELVACLAERRPGLRVTELLPRGRSGSPQIVGAEQLPERFVLVPGVDQRLGVDEQRSVAVGVDADCFPVELHETGAGYRNPVQRRLQSEQAM